MVPAQAEPDPDFPTVSFPNPEEPGALDLALADARRLEADLVLASDPDGDRLAVAVPDPAASGGWRKLTGDQVGGAARRVRARATRPPDGQAGPGSGQRLRIAAGRDHRGVVVAAVQDRRGGRSPVRRDAYWLQVDRPGRGSRPGTRFVFGYEEALGYAVGDVVRDKDGISAAIALLGLAAQAWAAGQSLLDRWDALEQAHGVHLTAQLTLPTRVPGEIMAGLRAAAPAPWASCRSAASTIWPGAALSCRPRTRSSSGWTAPGS